MKLFRVLVLANNLSPEVSIEDDLSTWQTYEKETLDIDLDITVRRVDVGKIFHKSFGIYTVAKDVKLDLYGLDGMMQRLRDRKLVEQGEYHAVVFLYDPSDSEMYKKNPGGIGHWTHFSQIYPGTEFTEIAVKKEWDNAGDIFRVLTHEIRHAYVFRLRRKGVPVTDVMDSTPTLVNCTTHERIPVGGDAANACVAYLPYLEEFSPLSTTGNRALQNRTVKPYVPKVVEGLELVNFIKRIIQQFLAQFENTMPKPKEDLLVRWAEAIKLHEGWFVGSRSYRNLNPGNFKGVLSAYMKSLGAIGRDKDGFMVFPSYEKGWQALLQFLRDSRENSLIPYRAFATKRDENLRKAGKTEGPKDKKGRSVCTLNDYYQVYAPEGDNVVPGFQNDPHSYAREVAKYIGNGVSVETPVDQL